MDDLSKKTREELETELIQLKKQIASGKSHFPGIAVIKKTEKKSYIQDEKFRVLFHHSPNGILLISNHKIVEFNPAALEIFQLKKEELFGKTISQLSIQQQPENRLKSDWKKIEQEVIGKTEVKKTLWFFSRGDKNFFQAEITVSSVHFDRKNHLLLIIRDLTYKRDLENTIKIFDKEQNIVQSGTWTINLKTHTATWSKSMMKMHHLNPKASPPTLREYIDRFVDKEQKSEFHTLVRNAIKTGKGFTIDLKVKIENNESKYFYFHCKTEREDDTKQSKLFGICLDITERKRLEKDLEENKESYKLLVNNLPDGVIIYTQEKILYANKGAFEIVGSKQLSPEEVKKKNIYQFLLEKYHPEIKRKIRLIYRGRELGDIEMKLKKFDGSVIDIRVKSNPIIFKGEPCIQAIFSDITQKKNVERHLKESERKLSTLIRNFPGMAYRCRMGEERFLEFVSEGSLLITGYSAAELLKKTAKTFAQMIHREDREKVSLTIQEAITNKSTFVIDYRIKKKNGDFVWVRERGSPVYNEGGTAEALEGFMTDISLQKKAEQEIIDSRENYKNLVDFLPTGLIIHQSGSIIYANNETLKLFKLNSSKEVVGKSVLDYVVPECHPDVIRRIKASNDGKEQPFFPLKLISSLGEIMEVETKSIPFLYDGKAATLVVIHDLSKEKMLKGESLRAEMAEQSNIILKEEILKREEIQQKLTQSQAYFRNILNSSIDIIVANDNSGKITEFNNAARKAFGYSEAELHNLYISALYRNHDEFVRVGDSLKKHGVFAGEVRNIDANGQAFSSYLIATGLFDDQGNMIGSMGVSRDLTMIKEEREKLRASEQGYKAIFNQAFIGIAKFSLSGELLQVNQHFCDMIERTERELTGLNIREVTHPEDRKMLSGYLESAVAEKKLQVFFEKRLLGKSSKVIYCNANLSLVRNDAKKPDYFIIVYSDITEKIKSQEKLLEQKSKLNAILESSSHLVFSFNKKMQLTSYNTNMQKFLQSVFNVFPYIGLKMDSEEMISTPENQALWSESVNKAFKGNAVNFQTTYYDRNGEESSWEIFLSPVMIIRGAIQEIAGVGHNITDKRKAEREMLDQRAKLEAIFQTTSNLIYTIDKNFKLTSFNKIYEKQTIKDLGLKPFIGAQTDQEVKHTFPEEQYDYFIKAHQLALKGIPQQYDYKVVDKNGNRNYYQVFLDPIILPDNSINEVVYMAHDITDKMAAKFEIYYSLKEKEVLLKEVHHRVKNNLQVISSILNLQRSYISDPETDDVFREIQNRIKSMSFIHESLYNTENFAALNFEEYLKNLIQNLQYSYQKKANRVEIDISAPGVQLSLDQSIPCGLIINELVSNAFKYAFEERKKGKLVVSMKEKAKFVELLVADNGVGFPENLDFSKTDTLGLQLVSSLVEQLDGTIEKQNKTKGTCFFIRFGKNE